MTKGGDEERYSCSSMNMVWERDSCLISRQFQCFLTIKIINLARIVFYHVNQEIERGMRRKSERQGIFLLSWAQRKPIHGGQRDEEMPPVNCTNESKQAATLIFLLLLIINLFSVLCFYAVYSALLCEITRHRPS